MLRKGSTGVQNHKMTYWKLADTRAALTCANQVIVRREFAQDAQVRSNYMIFSDPHTLLSAIESGNGTYHEITRTAEQEHPLPQRLYFDIDAKSDSWGAMTGQGFEQGIVDALRIAVDSVFRFNGTQKSMLVASSSNYAEKVSVHVTFPGLCFVHHESLKRAASSVAARLPEIFGRTVDMLYKRNNGLRLLFSTKLGTTRCKLPVQIGTSTPWPSDKIRALVLSTIHTYGSDVQFCDSTQLCDSIFPVQQLNLYDNVESDELIKRILKLIEKKETSASTSRGSSAGIPPAGGAYRERSCKSLGEGKFSISLDRMAPSFCIMCNRVHESDGCSIFVVNDAIYMKCMRTLGIKGSHCIYKPPRLQTTSVVLPVNYGNPTLSITEGEELVFEEEKELVPRVQVEEYLEFDDEPEIAPSVSVEELFID